MLELFNEFGKMKYVIIPVYLPHVVCCMWTWALKLEQIFAFLQNTDFTLLILQYNHRNVTEKNKTPRKNFHTNVYIFKVEGEV